MIQREDVTRFTVTPQPSESDSNVGLQQKPLTPLEQRIYKAQLQHSGKAAADDWLRRHRAGQPDAAPVVKSSANLPDALKSGAAKAEFARRAAEDLLERSRTRDVVGHDALALAEAVIGPQQKEKLGRSYPLVLALVKGTLEDGHRPGEEGANLHHVLSNYPTLGVLAAAVMDRERAYNEKTIRRWLAKDAPHAAALRCWLGWRHWYTGSLLAYSDHVNETTGELKIKKGESLGPVIGGTLFRVRLEPLSSISLERLAQCDVKKPSVVQPLKLELSKNWRDLEYDRHEGHTWPYGERSVYLEDINVRIDSKRTKDLNMKKIGCCYQTNKAHEQLAPKLLQQNPIYPDISTFEGACALRLAVDEAANCLLEIVEGGVTQAERDEKLNRYRHAFWTAYKAKLHGDTEDGLEHLRTLKRLAIEVHAQEKARRDKGERPQIKDVAAFCWSVIERRGFAELRRDYGGFVEGRYVRVFSTSIAKALSLT